MLKQASTKKPSQPEMNVNHNWNNQSKKKQSKKQRNNNSHNYYHSEQFIHGQENDYHMDPSEIKNLQKAVNSFLRHGKIGKKFEQFRPFIEQFFGFDEDQFGKEEKNKKKKTKSKGKKQSKLNLIHNLVVDIEQLGYEKRIKVERQVNCYQCENYSSKNFTRVGCKSCNRTGFAEDFQKCLNCDGKGYVKKHNCRLCDNKGYVKKKFDEIVILPVGIESGFQVVMEGRGHQDRKKGHYGDLIINVSLSYNQFESPKSNKKQQQIKLNVGEAVLGFQKKIQTKSGQRKVKVPAGCQDGVVLRTASLKSHESQHHQQYIKISVATPINLNKQQIEIYHKLRKLADDQI